jgi:hypothetical protein
LQKKWVAGIFMNITVCSGNLLLTARIYLVFALPYNPETEDKRLHFQKSKKQHQLRTGLVLLFP